MNEQEILAEYPFTKSFLYKTAPVNIPLEVQLLLFPKQNEDLLVPYMRLAQLDLLGLLPEMNQGDIAKHLGVSRQWITQLAKRLQKLGLLSIHKEGREHQFGLHFPLFTAEAYEEIGKVKYTLTVKVHFTYQEMQELLDNSSKIALKGVIPTTQKQLTLSNNIYTNTNNHKGNTVKQIPIKQELAKPAPKKAVQRFPKIQYNMVLNAYMKYTGVERKGPDLSFAIKSVRNLFLAGHKPQDIIKFMQWLSENCDDPNYKYLKLWNMETVRKLLPDFLSGRLTNEEEEDDGFRSLN